MFDRQRYRRPRDRSARRGLCCSELKYRSQTSRKVHHALQETVVQCGCVVTRGLDDFCRLMGGPLGSADPAGSRQAVVFKNEGHANQTMVVSGAVRQKSTAPCDIQPCLTTEEPLFRAPKIWYLVCSISGMALGWVRGGDHLRRQL
jgi:hypothetical protein